MLLGLEEATRPVCGGKALGLRQLLECGLPVPTAVCLPIDAYRAALPARLPPASALRDPGRLDEECGTLVEELLRWEPAPALAAELARALRALGGPLVVRSSATCEDDRLAPLPGLFVSTRDVRDPRALIAAIRRCFVSLWSTVAWVVLGQRGTWPGAEAMAVVIQREVRARSAGLLLSRDAARGGPMRLERVHGSAARLAAGMADPEVLLLPRRGRLPRAALAPSLLSMLRQAALALERRLAGPVEVEWVEDPAGRVHLVQVRPAGRPPRAASPAWRVKGDPSTRWHWDREHNPEPLSPVHESLVVRAGTAGSYQVVRGYLYARESRERGRPARDLAGRWERFVRRVAPRLTALEAAPEEPRVGLEGALSFFAAFTREYFGELARARQAARDRLARFLAVEGADPSWIGVLAVPRRHATLERTAALYRLARLARRDPSRGASLAEGDPPGELGRAWRAHLARYGSLVSSWDIAAPTLVEQPEVLARRVRALAEIDEDPTQAWRAQRRRAGRLLRDLLDRIPARRRPELERLVEQARVARRLEEEDDLLFARVLALVRRALLVAGKALVARGRLGRVDDVVLMRLDEVRAALRPGGRGVPARRLSRRREIWEERRRLCPPHTIQGERATWAAPPASAVVLRGQGIGGVARGRVRLITRLEQMLEGDLRGAVVVSATLLPALAIVLPEVAALVTDHGGLLSHAASLARELGQVAVVGTGCATRVLRDGEPVWVDGPRGLVVRAEEPG